MGLRFIQDFIKAKVDNGESGADIAKQLQVSISMVSSYKHHDYKPSLFVAKTAYKNEGIVLHPFSKESLKKEIADDTY
jgi:ribosome-binding protein aMBF1 (putative translation factor)